MLLNSVWSKKTQFFAQNVLQNWELKSSSESLSGQIQMQERTISTFEKHDRSLRKQKTGDLPAKNKERGKKAAQNDDCRKP